MYRYLLVFILILLIGCSENKQYPRNNYKPEIAVTIVKELIVDPSINDIVIQKYKRSECPECKGTGKYTTGDGLKTIECPYCEVGKGSIGQELSKLFPDGKCCEHCICGENCQCTYPGECLISKNNGWPVMICDTDKCVTYFPFDSTGEPYDPYKLGIENGTITSKNLKEYEKYRSPIKIDRLGNPITATSSSNCKTCSGR